MSDQSKHRSNSPTTISWPAGVVLSSAKNFPSTVLALISFSWLRKPSISAAGNCIQIQPIAANVMAEIEPLIEYWLPI